MFEPAVRHSGLGGQGSRKMPVSLAAHGGENGLALARAEHEEVAKLGANAAPLFPVARAHAPVQPPVEVRHGAVIECSGLEQLGRSTEAVRSWSCGVIGSL